MYLGNLFISVSKGQGQGHGSQKHCVRGSLHSGKIVRWMCSIWIGAVDDQ